MQGRRGAPQPAPPLAARDAAVRRVAHTRVGDVGEPERLQQRVHAMSIAARAFRRGRLQRGRECEGLAHSEHAKEGFALREHCDPRGLEGVVLAVALEALAPVVWGRACQRVQKRRLARARGAKHREQSACVCLNVRVREQRLAIVPHGDARPTQRRRWGRGRLRGGQQQSREHARDHAYTGEGGRSQAALEALDNTLILDKPLMWNEGIGYQTTRLRCGF